MTRLRYLLLLLPLAALAGVRRVRLAAEPRRRSALRARTSSPPSSRTGRSGERPTDVSFVIRQPDGKPLTAFKRGPGPHTGVHLIFVRDDLAYIVHRHPPIAADGTIQRPHHVPRARHVPGGNRRLSAQTGLSRTSSSSGPCTSAGVYKPQPLPPPTRTVTVDGYRFTMHGSPQLKAIEPAFLKLTVTDPRAGRPGSRRGTAHSRTRSSSAADRSTTSTRTSARRAQTAARARSARRG